jgi:hypothetical protein
MPHAVATGRPLFPYGDLYLDGRSNWFARLFHTDLESAAGADSRKPASVFKVHAQPFSSGPWLEKLDADGLEKRVRAETKAVETDVFFHLPGVDTDAVLSLLCSGFLEGVGDNEYVHDVFLPPIDGPLDGLDEPPHLSRGQFLSRIRWKGGFLADSTDAYYVNEVGGHGEAYTVVFEVWKNCGDESSAVIEVGSGQYSVVAFEAGAMVRLHTYYRGQGFPLLFEDVVTSKTRAFYEKLGSAFLEQLKSWQRDVALEAWLEPIRRDRSEPREP